jgi:hypothetical protein
LRLASAPTDPTECHQPKETTTMAAKKKAKAKAAPKKAPAKKKAAKKK